MEITTAPSYEDIFNYRREVRESYRQPPVRSLDDVMCAPLEEITDRAQSTMEFQKMNPSRVVHLYEHTMDEKTGKVFRVGTMARCGREFDPETESVPVQSKLLPGMVPCYICCHALMGHEG